MASYVITNEFVSLGGTDISAYLKSATLSYSAEEVDDSSMGDTTVNRIPGLKDWSMSLQAKDDNAAGAIDEVLWTLYAAGAVFTAIMKPVNAAVSTSNPQYSGSVMLSSTDKGGDHGSLAERPISLPGAGTLARATS